MSVREHDMQEGQEALALRVVGAQWRVGPGSRVSGAQREGARQVGGVSDQHAPQRTFRVDCVLLCDFEKYLSREHA